MGEAKALTVARESSRTAPQVGTSMPRALDMSIKLVAFAVPALYACGLEYGNGYWAEIGLPASMVDSQFEQTMYQGFIVIALAILKLLNNPYQTVGVILLALLVWFVITIVAVNMASEMRRFRRRRGTSRTLIAKVAWLRRYRFVRRMRFRAWRRNHERLFDRGYVIVQAAYAAVVFLLMIGILPLIGISSLGNERAKEDRIRYRTWEAKGPEQKTLVMVFKKDGAVKQALFRECQPAWCVGFEGGEFFAVKADAVTEIRRPTPTKKSGT